MKRVWLAQLKCSNDHCIMAAAALCTSEAAPRLGEKVRREFDLLVTAKAIDPWCGICRSKSVHIDLKEMGWLTLDEADGPLSESMEAQRATANFIRRSRN